MDQSNGCQQLPEQDRFLLGIAIDFFKEFGNNDGLKNPDAASISIDGSNPVAEANELEHIGEDPKTLEDLHQLPLCEILKKVDMVEILDLALSSLPIRDAAISLRLSVASMKWIIIAPGHFVIHLVPMDPNQNRIIFKLAQGSSATFHPAYVNYQEVQIARSRSVFTVKCGSYFEEKVKLLDDLTKTILEIVKVKEFNFQSNIYVDFPFALTKSCRSFFLSGGSLTSVQMRTVMEEISVDIFKLENVFYTDSGNKVFQLKHRDMQLPLPPRMCLQVLIDSKCEKLRITPKPEGFMVFERSWITRMMAQFTFSTSTDEDPMIQFCKRIVSELQSCGVAKQLEGWPIERSDGRKAVVHFDLPNLCLNLID